MLKNATTASLWLAGIAAILTLAPLPGSAQQVRLASGVGPAGAGQLDTLPASQGGGPNPCTTMPCTLRHAIRVADRGDTVLIQQGPVNDHDLIVNKDLTITGPNCPLRVNINAQGRGRHFEIASAWAARVTLSCLNLVNGEAPDGGAVWLGAEGTLTLSDGRISGAMADRGGAIFSAGGEVTVLRSELVDNTAETNGGAILGSGGRITVRDQSELSRNTAGGDGGAIFSASGGVTVRHSDVADNVAGADGGAIAAIGDDVIITTTELTGNIAGDDGGALHGFTATLEVSKQSMLRGNRAAHRGGAVFANASTLTIDGSTFEANEASDSGGAVAVTTGFDTTITASELTNNVATADGGAVFREHGGPLTLSDAQFEGNSAARGGALADLPGTASGVATTTTVSQSLFAANTASELGGAILYDAGGTTPGSFEPVQGRLRVVNSTFSGNQATTDGGAIFNNLGGELSVAYSTFFGNTANPGGADMDGGNLEGGAFTTLGPAFLFYSIESTNQPQGCATAGAVSLIGRDNLTETCSGTSTFGRVFSHAPVTNLDPDLGWNFGTTPTHALLAGSNAIDLGPTSCRDDHLDVAVSLDQRGEVRPFDGNEDGVAKCDIGAFELHPMGKIPNPNPPGSSPQF